MNWKYGYFLAFFIPGVVVVGTFKGGIFHFLTPVLVFGIIPFIDYLVGRREVKLNRDKQELLKSQVFYSIILIFWVFVQTVFLVWAFVVFPGLNFWWEKTGFIISSGIVTGGIGITVAHELGHKKSFWERFLSKWLLMQVCYMHFYIEHNRGHHVWVATEKDPATAGKSESLYRFWFKSVLGGYAHAWKLEHERLTKKGISKYGLSNQMIWFSIIPLIFLGSLMFLFFILGFGWHWEQLGFFILQSIVGFSLLEMVNYVEHYGLKRNILSNGRYEPVGEHHSWNSDFVVSNLLLFQLQLHTDHHMHAIKRYQTLVSYKESPQLPGGYPSMILLAMLPFYWFRIINPILEKWENRFV